MSTQPCSLSTFKSLSKILLCHANKKTTTKLSYTQLLDGCFPDHCFHTEQSWFILSLCFPCLSGLLHLLMAELHSRL